MTPETGNSRHRRPPRRSFAASAGVHLLVFLAAWVTQTGAAPPVEFEVIEINLVSPPPAAAAEVVQPAREEELVVETPVTEPEPEEVVEDEVPPPEPEEQPAPEPEPEEEPPPEEEPEPEPPVEESTDTPPPPDPETPPEDAATDEPSETAEESGEDIDIRIAGVRRDYPAYYNNIIRQIRRCFRWRGQGNPTGTLQFIIEQDGTIPTGSIEVVQRSGTVEFDFEMMGAVECASGRLGALPDGYPFPTLPIRFSFDPNLIREDPEMPQDPLNPKDAKDPDA